MCVVLTDRHQLSIWPYDNVLRKSSNEQVIIFIIFLYLLATLNSSLRFKPALLHREAIQSLSFTTSVFLWPSSKPKQRTSMVKIFVLMHSHRNTLAGAERRGCCGEWKARMKFN